MRDMRSQGARKLDDFRVAGGRFVHVGFRHQHFSINEFFGFEEHAYIDGPMAPNYNEFSGQHMDPVWTFEPDE